MEEQADRLVRIESVLEVLQTDRQHALTEVASLRGLLDRRAGADEEAEVARAVLDTRLFSAEVGCCSLYLA